MKYTEYTVYPPGSSPRRRRNVYACHATPVQEKRIKDLRISQGARRSRIPSPPGVLIYETTDWRSRPFRTVLYIEPRRNLPLPIDRRRYKCAKHGCGFYFAFIADDAAIIDRYHDYRHRDPVVDGRSNWQRSCPVCGRHNMLWYLRDGRYPEPIESVKEHRRINGWPNTD